MSSMYFSDSSRDNFFFQIGESIVPCKICAGAENYGENNAYVHFDIAIEGKDLPADWKIFLLRRFRLLESNWRAGDKIAQLRINLQERTFWVLKEEVA